MSEKAKKKDDKKPSATARIEELEAALEAANARVTTAEDTAARLRVAHTEAAAEFARTRDRLERNHKREIERARLDMTRDLFELADNLDRMVTAAQAGGDGLVEGVGLVRDQFFASLGKLGLERYSPVGEPFDPEQHEAVGMMSVEEEWRDGKVAVVLQPGFRAGAHVLRAAVVQVGKYTAPAPEETANAEEQIQ